MSLSSLYAQGMTLAAFLKARRLMHRLDTRDKLDKYKHLMLDRFLQKTAPNAPAFAEITNRDLVDWPIMDKADLMADFARYNTIGLTTDAAWTAFDTGARVDGKYDIGASTGTSGNRGLYIVSSKERYKWLGAILSRAVPDVLSTHHRVAAILPTASRLYDSVNESRRLSLKFFDLKHGIDAHLNSVAAFNPTIIIAPPKMLRALAAADIALAPQSVFSGAEVLSLEDKAFVEARFNTVVREIYMATEGLFAVACEYGTMHLLEDHVFFEWEAVESSTNIVAPLITDFSRQNQIMVRYRMNDLLELQADECPCGSPHQSIKAIHGRCDDVFYLTGATGASIALTPDIIRNAVIAVDRNIEDYRVIQTGPDSVRLELSAQNTAHLPAAKQALKTLFQSVGANPEIIARIGQLTPTGSHKLRRVMVEKS